MRLGRLANRRTGEKFPNGHAGAPAVTQKWLAKIRDIEDYRVCDMLILPGFFRRPACIRGGLCVSGAMRLDRAYGR
jgi:hypothetical protein